MAKFVDAITAHPDAMYFRVGDSAPEPRDWELEPLQTEVLSDSEGDSYWVIRSLHVLSDGTIRQCHMDMSLPERISDYVFFLDNRSLRFGYHHEFPGVIIPAAALDCLGIYDQYYSRRRPDVGIDVLRRGLTVAKRKTYIAQDLGYIFRDEHRFAEAAEMFKVALEEGPCSYFIYGELADAYAKLGDAQNAQKYSELFKQGERDWGMIPPRR
jgi:hypothetical protein